MFRSRQQVCLHAVNSRVMVRVRERPFTNTPSSHLKAEQMRERMKQMKIKVAPLLANDLRENIMGEGMGGATLDILIWNPSGEAHPHPVLETISLTLWGRIPVPFTLGQGAEMSHSFCKLHTPEKQQPGASPPSILTFQLLSPCACGGRAEAAAGGKEAPGKEASSRKTAFRCALRCDKLWIRRAESWRL